MRPVVSGRTVDRSRMEGARGGTVAVLNAVGSGDHKRVPLMPAEVGQISHVHQNGHRTRDEEDGHGEKTGLGVLR